MQNFAIYPSEDARFELEFETFQLNVETGEVELYDDNRELIGSSFGSILLPSYRLNCGQRSERICSLFLFTSRITSTSHSC